MVWGTIGRWDTALARPRTLDRCSPLRVRLPARSVSWVSLPEHTYNLLVKWAGFGTLAEAVQSSASGGAFQKVVALAKRTRCVAAHGETTVHAVAFLSTGRPPVVAKPNPPVGKGDGKGMGKGKGKGKRKWK